MKIRTLVFGAIISLLSAASAVGEVTLIVGQGTDPVILDPPMYSDTPTHNLNLLIYDRLYNLSKDGQVVPGLAVDLPKIEDNGTKYTITIRSGVKFHNGAPLTIDDVIYSFQRGAFNDKSQMKSIFAMMYDVKKIDDYAFQFRTGIFDPSKAPSTVHDADLTSFKARAPYYKPVAFGSQLNQLTWLGASIVNKSTLEKAQADGSIKDYGLTWAIGSGPFKFVSWSQGDNVTLVRNKDYYDTTLKTNVDKIVFKTIRDPSALKTAFLNKEVDVIMNVVPLDARDIEQQGGKILSTNGYFGYHYLAFNMKSPRVGQVTANGSPVLDGNYDLTSASTRLRLAILYAINPADIVNSPDIMDKRGRVTLQYVETLPFGHIDNPTGTRIAEGNLKTGYYDPQKAREILASLPASLKQPGSLKCTTLSGSVFVKEALVIKDQVKKVLGVDLINIEQVALSEMGTRRRNTDPNVWDLMVYWTQTDDSYYIFVAFDGTNTSLLHDTKYYTVSAQTWIDKGNSLPNGPERNIAYQNAQKEILKAVPRVPLVAILGISACQNYVDGVDIAPSGSFMLYNVTKDVNK
jgi:peptide/nickel transport system substrate-binding protein